MNIIREDDEIDIRVSKHYVWEGKLLIGTIIEYVYHATSSRNHDGSLHPLRPIGRLLYLFVVLISLLFVVLIPLH